MKSGYLILILLFICACGETGASVDGTPDGDSDSDTDGDGDGDSDSDTDSDTDGDSDSDTDSDTDGDTGTDTDTDTDSDTDADTDTDTDSDTDADTDTDTDSDTDADTDSDGDSETESVPSFIIEENESGFCELDGVVESVHPGFSGDGYANTTNAAAVSISWQITLAESGTASLSWVYAFVGDGARSGRLLVDGETVVDSVVFESTATWESWMVNEAEVPLSDGEHAIRLESTSTDGLPNIDLLTIAGLAGAAAECSPVVDTDTGEDTEEDTGEDTGEDTTVDPDSPVTVYIAGDSTVSQYTDTPSTTDQAGWGQMLHEYLNDLATVENRAKGGRTALWFYMEGAVDNIMSTIAPGDYFLIQFGTNDGHKTATFEVGGVTYPRYADPNTDFKQHLLDYYITPARNAGAIPVLVTPPPRNSAYCTGGNSLGGYAQAMRELGEAENVAVSDLNTKTVDHLIAICPSPTPEDFFFLRSDGSVDGTHFQENGARIMAGFVMDGIGEAGLGLASYRD